MVIVKFKSRLHLKCSGSVTISIKAFYTYNLVIGENDILAYSYTYTIYLFYIILNSCSL